MNDNSDHYAVLIDEASRWCDRNSIGQYFDFEGCIHNTASHTLKIKKLGQNLTELDFFGSPARTPFGYAQGKLTADFSIKDNFFLRDHPLI